MEIKTIAVIGVGMVGAQVKRWFDEQNKFEVLAYTPSMKYDSWEKCLTADIFFLCVPTPYEEGKEYDTSALDNAIAEIPDGKVIVIKSTVNPGTTDLYQQMYPKKVIIFNPEFLTELTAWEDFIHPDMQIMGVPYQGYEIASELMQILPRSKVMKVVSPIDAEWIKKGRNAYYAMKVIFFNQLYDLMNETPADYETVRATLVEDPRIANSHSFIFHKSYRGFSGKCLPKDLYSLIGWADRMGKVSELFNTVRKINKDLFKLQGKKDI